MRRCIPYRYKCVKQSLEINEEDLEVLVISSQKGKGMLFPKVLNFDFVGMNEKLCLLNIDSFEQLNSDDSREVDLTKYNFTGRLGN